MANTDPVIVIEQKDEKKKRGALALILAVAFVAILAIGGTFAYLTYTANQTPNRFTTGELTADVLEPAWTNKALSDNLGDDGSTPDVKYTASDNVAIPQDAYAMIPGSVTAKNPFVVNTSKTASALGFGALKVLFQKWNKTATGDTDGSWVKMSNTEVAALLKCYYIGSTAYDADSTTAGFTDLGANWSQYTATEDASYVATAAGSSDTNGQMYFVNKTRLYSMADTDNGEKPDETADATKTSTTWGFTADNTKSSTTPLFNYVRFMDTAAQSDIDALMAILDPSGTQLNEGATFTPGWRMVISGACMQTTADDDDPTTASSIWATSFKTLLDKNSTVNRTGTTKPQSASGVREGSTLGTYIDKDGAKQDGVGIPEPSNEAAAS